MNTILSNEDIATFINIQTKLHRLESLNFGSVGYFNELNKALGIIDYDSVIFGGSGGGSAMSLRGKEIAKYTLNYIEGRVNICFNEDWDKDNYFQKRFNIWKKGYKILRKSNFSEEEIEFLMKIKRIVGNHLFDNYFVPQDKQPIELLAANAVSDGEEPKQMPMSIDDFIKKLQAISEDKRKLPLVIECPNGEYTFPKIKMFWDESTMFEDKPDKMVITYK